MSSQIDAFIMPLHAFWGEIAVFTPKLLAASVLLLVGWVAARLLRAGVKRTLEAVGFARLSEKSGLEALLRQAGIEISLAGIIAGVVYWTLLLVVVISAAGSLGLDAVAVLTNKVVLYLPNIIVAILIMIFGTLLARTVNRIVFAWLNGMKAPLALTLSTGSEYAVQVFAAFMALEQLGIATHVLTLIFGITFAGIVFALALAFGLGGQSWASEHIRNWHESHKK